MGFRASTGVKDQYKSAVFISGLVTFIAAYHYIRIFNSWVEAYEYGAGALVGGAMEMKDPTWAGVPFNDAYRYMDWLLTVPLLLIEILLVMKLDEQTYNSKAWTLGLGSALMICSGYYGELVVTGDLTPRWAGWCHCQRVRPCHRRQDPYSAGHDSGQLVHIPCCVLVSNVSNLCCTSSGWNSDWLLLL